jgi:hypothetical protein
LRYKVYEATGQYDIMADSGGDEIMAFVSVEGPPTLQVIEDAPEQLIGEIEEQNPDRWLAIEITEEVDYEPTKGRLLATAVNNEELVGILRPYVETGRKCALLYGVCTQPTPDYIL